MIIHTAIRYVVWGSTEIRKKRWTHFCLESVIPAVPGI